MTMAHLSSMSRTPLAPHSWRRRSLRLVNWRPKFSRSCRRLTRRSPFFRWKARKSTDSITSICCSHGSRSFQQTLPTRSPATCRRNDSRASKKHGRKGGQKVFLSARSSTAPPPELGSEGRGALVPRNSRKKQPRPYGRRRAIKVSYCATSRAGEVSAGASTASTCSPINIASSSSVTSETTVFGNISL